MKDRRRRRYRRHHHHYHLFSISQLTYIYCIYTAVQKKLHKVQCAIILQSFAAESRKFYQDAQAITGTIEKRPNFECCD